MHFEHAVDERRRDPVDLDSLLSSCSLNIGRAWKTRQDGGHRCVFGLLAA